MYKVQMNGPLPNTTVPNNNSNTRPKYEFFQRYVHQLHHQRNQDTTTKNPIKTPQRTTIWPFPTGNNSIRVWLDTTKKPQRTISHRSTLIGITAIQFSPRTEHFYCTSTYKLTTTQARLAPWIIDTHLTNVAPPNATMPRAWLGLFVQRWLCGTVEHTC